MTPYVCKDPECTEDFTWHLINADPECLFENREAIAAFAADVADERHHVVLYVTAEGFEDQKIDIDLIPTSHIPHSTPDEDDTLVFDNTSLIVDGKLEIKPSEPEPPMDGHPDAHS